MYADMNNTKKRKICSSVDIKNTKTKKYKEDKEDNNLHNLLKNRIKLERERYKCMKIIGNNEKLEKEINKKIYALCEHKWVAEERQMYEKRWYHCDVCGLYKNPYMYR